EYRRERPGDDLAAGLAEHEAHGRDQLSVAAGHGLIAVHEFIRVEHERFVFDLVPALAKEHVLDLSQLYPERHRDVPPVRPLAGLSWSSPRVRLPTELRSAVIRNGHSYRAVPLAGQLVHHRSAHPGPLVLGATPLNSPARTLDRDRLPVTRPAGFLFPLAPCVAAGFRPYLLAN